MYQQIICTLYHFDFKTVKRIYLLLEGSTESLPFCREEVGQEGLWWTIPGCGAFFMMSRLLLIDSQCQENTCKTQKVQAGDIPLG